MSVLLTPEDTARSPPALVTVDVTREWGAGYALFLEDVCRMLCIQLTIQMMLYFSGSPGTAFFSTEFLLMLAYVVMGVALYWLVLKRVVIFK